MPIFEDGFRFTVTPDGEASTGDVVQVLVEGEDVKRWVELELLAFNDVVSGTECVLNGKKEALFKTNVPRGATTGPLDAQVTLHGTARYLELVPRFRITGPSEGEEDLPPLAMTSAQYMNGTQIKVLGTGFVYEPGDVLMEVYFPASPDGPPTLRSPRVQVQSLTSLLVMIPAHAATGRIRLVRQRKGAAPEVRLSPFSVVFHDE